MADKILREFLTNAGVAYESGEGCLESRDHSSEELNGDDHDHGVPMSGEGSLESRDHSSEELNGDDHDHGVPMSGEALEQQQQKLQVQDESEEDDGDGVSDMSPESDPPSDSGDSWHEWSDDDDVWKKKRSRLKIRRNSVLKKLKSPNVLPPKIIQESQRCLPQLENSADNLSIPSSSKAPEVASVPSRRLLRRSPRRRSSNSVVLLSPESEDHVGTSCQASSSRTTKATTSRYRPRRKPFVAPPAAVVIDPVADIFAAKSLSDFDHWNQAELEILDKNLKLDGKLNNKNIDKLKKVLPSKSNIQIAEMLLYLQKLANAELKQEKEADKSSLADNQRLERVGMLLKDLVSPREFDFSQGFDQVLLKVGDAIREEMEADNELNLKDLYKYAAELFKPDSHLPPLTPICALAIDECFQKIVNNVKNDPRLQEKQAFLRKQFAILSKPCDNLVQPQPQQERLVLLEIALSALKPEHFSDKMWNSKWGKKDEIRTLNPLNIPSNLHEQTDEQKVARTRAVPPTNVSKANGKLFMKMRLRPTHRRKTSQAKDNEKTKSRD